MVRTRAEIEQLIAAYLNGEAMPEEAMWLEDWRRESLENQRFFEAFEKVNSLGNSEEEFQSPNMESAWKNIAGGIESKEPQDGKVVPLWRTPQFIMGVAAVGIVAFLLGVFFNSLSEPEVIISDKTNDVNIPEETHQETVLLASDNVASFVLEDHSKVELTEGSRLILADDFNENGRRSVLEGSGTFEVIHDEDNPFVVTVGELEVFDIGTVFEINASGDTVKVVVSEGEVELRLNGETLGLVEGDSAFYVISDQIMERYKTEEALQDYVFEFDGTNLKEVASILGKFFKKKIVVMDETIAECPLSVTFRNEDLATILDIIKELLDVRIIRNKDIIGIYGEGCNE